MDFIKRVVALPGETIALDFAPFRVPMKGDTVRLETERPELYGHLVANELGITGRAQGDAFVSGDP